MGRKKLPDVIVIDITQQMIWDSNGWVIGECAVQKALQPLLDKYECSVRITSKLISFHRRNVYGDLKVARYDVGPIGYEWIRGHYSWIVDGKIKTWPDVPIKFKIIRRK